MTGWIGRAGSTLTGLPRRLGSALRGNPSASRQAREEPRAGAAPDDRNAQPPAPPSRSATPLAPAEAPPETAVEAPTGYPVAQTLTSEGHPPVAVVDLGREISDAVRASWGAGGRPASGGVIESAWLQPLFAAGGAAASSLAAGNVFVATANPATLMAIGGGVSSAVMGGSGIVAHAPFVAAGSALVPVVAPVMLFMAISSLTTGRRLDRMQQEVGALSEVLTRVRSFMEAGTYARFQTAASQLDEIWAQFENGQRFTDAMRTELVQARRDMQTLRRQYGHLTARTVRSENEATTTVSDINLYFLSSLMATRADVLRLFLTLQDDPAFAPQRQQDLLRRVRKDRSELRRLVEENPVQAFRDELEDKLSKVRFYNPDSRLGRMFGGRLPERIQNVDAIAESFRPIRQRIEQWTAADPTSGDAGTHQSIVIYNDGDGKLQARHTTDLRLEPAPKSTNTSKTPQDR